MPCMKRQEARLVDRQLEHGTGDARFIRWRNRAGSTSDVSRCAGTARAYQRLEGRPLPKRNGRVGLVMAAASQISRTEVASCAHRERSSEVVRMRSAEPAGKDRLLLPADSNSWKVPQRRRLVLSRQYTDR